MLPPGLHSQYSKQRGVNVKLMKLRFTKTFLILLLSLFYLATLPSSFALDPNRNYMKISSEHFDVIYDAKSYDLAKLYLEEAERSYEILKDVFGIAPDKTVVILDDSIDIANGTATGVPRPSVTIYINPPTPLSTVDHFSSWPRDVFLHEYAHILNMEPARGIMKPFRYIFGSFVRPNMYLPRWYLEGLAVEVESRFNEFGRLKSQDYDSLIRSLYLDGLWGNETLSSINEVTIPYWPQGQRPYFYGALIWHELIQSKSISVVRTFNERYARRVPWFITQPMVDELGQTYEIFLKNVFSKYGEIARAQVQKIQEQPTTQGKPILTKNGVFNHSPELSPDGEKLLFISQNLNKESIVYIFKKLAETWIPVDSVRLEEDHEPLANFTKKDIQKAAWFPDSKRIVFDSIESHKNWNRYFDLFIFDLDSNETSRLTKGLRAREPAVSPDGQYIVYVKGGQGKTLLGIIKSDGTDEQILYDPENYERISRPSFINEREIVFSQKKNGIDKLHIFDLESKTVSRILDMPGQFPVATPSGIIFSSSKSGVKNLYITPPDFTAVRPLTSSLTKVLNGTVDPKSNSIIYSELTGNGQQIKEAPITDALLILPPIIHPIAHNYQEQIKDKPALNPTPKNYSAFPYMLPQFWFPFLNFVDDGLIGSVAIPGVDPTGFHSYVLSGTYDSRPKKFSGYFNYQYVNPLGVTSLAGGNYYQWYSSLDRHTSSQQALVRHSFRLPPEDSILAYIGYEYKRSNIFETISGTSQSRNHYFDGPSVGLSFSGMQKKAMDISPSGQQASLRYTHYLKNTTDTDYHETFVKLSHFHKKWLPERHVLAITTQGSFTPRNRSLILGTTTTDSEYLLGTLGNFITRGYPAGEFVGYSVAMGTLEYRFPIREIWQGPDNPKPYFLKRTHGAIYGETITVDGIYFGADENSHRAKLGKYFTSVGFDYNIDMTLFYHAPVTVKIGVGYGLESEANGGFKIYSSLAAPTLF